MTAWWWFLVAASAYVGVSVLLGLLLSAVLRLVSHDASTILEQERAAVAIGQTAPRQARRRSGTLPRRAGRASAAAHD